MTPRARPTAAVDWAEIRRRVEAAGRAIAGSGDLSPERSRELLEARALSLAGPAESATSLDATLEVLTFAVAGELLAVETRHVMGVLPLKQAAPLPGAAPPVWGVTVWRGDLLTVLDVRTELGISVEAPSEPAWVVVLGAAEPAFGLLVSQARDVVHLPRTDFRSLSGGEGARRNYVRGVSREAVLLLDGEGLLHAYGQTG